MLTITASDDWRATHPGATIGLLELSGVDNARPAPALDAEKRAIETRLRGRFSGSARADFLALPTMAAYNKYYRRFNKTYHVLLQLESIVLKAKRLPDVSPLVDVNFMAEVETLILTAGHDVTKLVPPVVMDIARAGDVMVRMNGAPKEIDPGDMVMRDASGVVCSILYGQDNVSPITPSTTNALYVAYAPAGVSSEEVEGHLRKVQENVRVFCPEFVLEQIRSLTV
jgi:DNA/RNA-binding domain of Phe-tRNA-synthetase-like protein